MTNNSNIFLSPGLWLILALTLGLAPFTPEPHIWEKLKWIWSGAEAMQAIDWFDFLLHGTPWVLLLYTLIRKIVRN